MTFKFSKMWKYGVVLGAGVSTVAALHYNRWDIGTFGMVRFGRAAATVGKIMVDYKISFYNVKDTDENYQEVKTQVHKRSALRLLELCCANGGVFIKVGQHLGALDYLLPPEYVSTLRVLHSQAPKSSLEDVLVVLKEDLKVDPQELFTFFDPEPIGAASLAQVHKAVTKDGTTVAVKVQHRFVKPRSYVDIKTMEILVNLVAWAFPDFQLLWLAEETKKNLPVELDFINEGKNAERVRRMFAHYKWFKVPSIYWELSTGRVLTMEYCNGGQVNDRKYMNEHGIPVHEVTRNLGKLYSEMIFVQGYVHCDPHPGNILVDNSSGSTKIVLLDHGLYMTLTDSFRMNYANMWLSLLDRNEAAIADLSHKMGVRPPLHVLLASMMTARSWKSIRAGIDKQQATESEDLEIKAYIGEYLHVITEVLNMVPREMLFIFKTNDLLRSIEYTLKSPANASSFINMSRCCVRAIAQNRMQNCSSMTCKLRTVCSTRWSLFKISCYELYVWFWASCLGRLINGSNLAMLTAAR